MSNADLILHLIDMLMQKEKELNQLAIDKILEQQKSNVKKQDEE